MEKLISLRELNLQKKTPLRVPFSLGRSARGIPFDKNLIKDPFYNIIYQKSENKNTREIIDYLFEILKDEDNLSAADIVGLKKNNKLKQYPPWSSVLPWEKTDIDFKFKTYENIQKATREQKAFEYNFQNRIAKENYLCSIEMAESHVIQTMKLLENIKKIGFKPKLGLPSFHILIKDKEWKWYMSQGNHRAYILYHLNFKFIYGTIDSLIFREESYLWPNVLNGLYTIEESEIVFDYLFEGKRSISSNI